jgi:hypothetical protein
MFNNIDVETTDEKVQALLDYLNEENDTKLTADDIKVEEQSYSKSGALYHTPFGTYNVLTDSESYDAAYQRINDIWDDLGLESFTPNAQIYIRDNFIKPTDSLDEYMEEDFYEYYTDIESESDSCFENRLQRELAEVDGFFEDDMQRYLDLKEQKEDLRVELNDIKYDIKKLEEKIAKEEDNPYKEKLKEDLKDLTRERDRISERLEVVWVEFDYDEFTKWIEPYEDNKDNLIDKAVQTKMADWDNSLEWYLDEFGKGTIGYLLNNGLAEIDMDGLVDYIIDTDGRGCELAGWDGVENEQDDFYIYKQDNFIYECDKLDKEEECEMAD